MDDRPPRLPTCARRVVKACRLLPWSARALLLEIHELDAGPEGCWLSVPGLAERLGQDPSAIEKYLKRFRELGLVHRLKRPGARTPGWVLVLPPEGVPTSERPGPEEIRHCRDALESYLASHQTRPGAGMKPDPVPLPPATETRRHSSIRPDAHPVSVERGGVGGASPTAGETCEAPLPPAVPVRAVGVGAHAPEQQMERTTVVDPKLASLVERWRAKAEPRTGDASRGLDG